MDTTSAARRWARTWAEAWPARDADAIVALQAPDGDHWASLFRPCRGSDGLRRYVEECFADETTPARTRFAEPRVDGDTAAVEYWVVMGLRDGPHTVSGCTLVRFDAAGLVAEARDYSHVREGTHEPPGHVTWAFTSG